MIPTPAHGHPPAVEAGVRALLHRRAGDHWRGFPTLAGLSEVWVTAFLVVHLAEVERLDGFAAELPGVLREARRFLRFAHRPGGGWGYGGPVPDDADSTAWCLLALARDAEASTERTDGHAALDRHRRADGYATYLPDSGIRDFLGTPPSASLAGWTRAHADVTVAALLARSAMTANAKATHPEAVWHPEDQQLLADRTREQTGAGWYHAYWWRDSHYTTTLLCRLWRRRDEILPAVHRGRLVRALRREELPGGGYRLGGGREVSPFQTALALETLCHLSAWGEGVSTLGQRCRQALLDSVDADGAWRGEPVLRIPAPDVLDPATVSRWSLGSGGGNAFVEDVDGLFATVLACHSLALAERDLARRSAPQRESRSASVTPASGGAAP